MKRRLLDWLKFVASVGGSFYVLMTVSLLTHELLGHVSAGMLCGGARVPGVLGASGMAGFVRDHFRIESGRSLRNVVLMSFTVPMALAVLSAPGLPNRTQSTRISRRRFAAPSLPRSCRAQPPAASLRPVSRWPR